MTYRKKIEPIHGDLENTGHVNKKRARELKADKALSRCLAFSAQNCANSKETFKATATYAVPADFTI